MALLSLGTIGCEIVEEILHPYTEPEWTGVVRIGDREFVTDGTLALDVTLAEPEQLPERHVAPWFEEAFRAQTVAERRDLFSLYELVTSEVDDKARGPEASKLIVDGPSVDYLQAKLANHTVRIWQRQRMEPLVIVIKDEPVGAIKVISQR